MGQKIILNLQIIAWMEKKKNKGEMKTRVATVVKAWRMRSRLSGEGWNFLIQKSRLNTSKAISKYDVLK
jgi:hypothetical protein